MKLTIKLPDELFEKLEPIATGRGYKTVEALVEKNIDSLLKLDNKQAQILLESQHLTALSKCLGGKVFKTPDDVVKQLVDNFRISVNGITVDMFPEDIESLKGQFDPSSGKPFEKFVADSINDMLSAYLWGSTRGLTYA